jgi:hypothetical protein
MISLFITEQCLMTLLLLMSIVQIYLLFYFHANWSHVKADVVLLLRCLSFVVLVGFLWSKKAPTWSQIVFGLTPQHPHHSKWCALSFRTVYCLSGPSYSIYESAFSNPSSNRTVAVTLPVSTVCHFINLGNDCSHTQRLVLLAPSPTCWPIHPLYNLSGCGVMVLVVRWANDEGFVGVVHGVWTLQAYYVWAMALPLLIIAIMGEVWKSWAIALEVCHA